MAGRSYPRKFDWDEAKRRHADPRSGVENKMLGRIGRRDLLEPLVLTMAVSA